MKDPCVELTTQEKLEIPISELGLPVRIVNALEEHRQIFIVKDLLMHRAADILRIPNFGHKTMETIFERLAVLGFVKRKGSKA